MRDSAHTVIQAHNTINDKAEEIVKILNTLSSREKLFIMALVNSSVNHTIEKEATTRDMCRGLESVNKMLKHIFTMGD